MKSILTIEENEMLTQTQIVNAMNRLDEVILNGSTEAIRIDAYVKRNEYAEMLFNHKYVY